MRSTLLRRLEKMETRIGPEALPCYCYGWVKPLPSEFTGEKHIVLVKAEPAGSPLVKWCEFEERAGAAPCTTDGYPAVPRKRS